MLGKRKSETSGHWKRIIGGVMAAVLLVPVPVFAIDFTGVNWSFSVNGAAPTTFTTNGSGSEKTTEPWQGNGSVVVAASTIDDLLTFNFKTANVTLNDTVVFTSSVIPAGTVSGQWGNLVTLNPPGGGTATVSMGLGSPNTNNMFAQTTSPFTGNESITSRTANGTTDIITLTFVFGDGTGNSQGTKAVYNLQGSGNAATTYTLHLQ